MAYQKKNLLEAFQASARVEKSDDRPLVGGPTPKSGGPFAGEGHAPSTSEWNGLPPLGLRLDAPWPWGLSLGAAALVFFLLGRITAPDAREVQAAESPSVASDASGSLVEADGQSAPSAGPDAASVAHQPQTAAERALLDPRNKYTVKLIEYRAGADEELAAKTRRWLEESEGLPAVAWSQGARLFVLLGAEATKADLSELERRAKTMDGPPPRRRPAEFGDAFIVAIDRLIDREGVQ